MVSILPQKRSPWELIGSAMSQFGQNAPQQLEERFQTQRGLGAIDQLQKDLADSGGDISKMLPALAKAYTLNKNLERSGLGQQYLSLAQRGKGAEDFPAGGGMPTKQGETTEQQVPVSVKDLVPARQSMVQNPQGVTDFQLPYGPEEVAGIRQAARQRGYLPEMEERFVKDAMEYNQIAQNRRNVELQNYQQAQQQREDTLKNQSAFENYLTQHSPEFTNNPDELQLALQASEKYQKEPSFADRNAKVKEELRPYQAAKKALEKTLSRPLFGQTKDQRDLARPRAQYMVDHGQKPQLQLMIAKGGQGEVEEADLLNPLPKDLDTRLERFNKLINPTSTVTNLDPDSKEFNEQVRLGQQKRDKQLDLMSDYLSKEIVPGTYDKPGPNLLLIRKHLMDKGSSWEEAAKTIDTAVSKGKIKLDPQQQIDSQKLAYPPLTADTYFDTVMNNLMFPVTGKQ